MSGSPSLLDRPAACEALSAFLSGERYDITTLSKDLGLTLLELGRGVVSYALSPVFEDDLNLMMLLTRYRLSWGDFYVAHLLATGAGTRPAPRSLATLLDPELGRLGAAASEAVVGLLDLLPDGFENHVLEEVRKNVDPGLITEIEEGLTRDLLDAPSTIPEHEDDRPVEQAVFAAFCYEDPDSFIGQYVSQTVADLAENGTTVYLFARRHFPGDELGIRTHAVGECAGEGILGSVQEFT